MSEEHNKTLMRKKAENMFDGTEQKEKGKCESLFKNGERETVSIGEE